MCKFSTAVKIAREPGEIFNLNTERLLENKRQGICTSIFLDTNILLGISNYMSEIDSEPNQSSLVKYNLKEFVDLCEYCQKYNIPFSLSPGFCMPEVSPDSFHDVKKRFDDFFPLHNLHVLDDPEGNNASPILEIQNILSLPDDEIKIRSLPFLNTCAMLLTEITEPDSHPWGKFDRFLELVKEYIGLFSEKELTVAKIVIGDIAKNNPDLLDKEGRDLVKDIQNNFSRTKKKKKPKTSEEAIRIAFNAANDFTMVNVAVERDKKSLDGIPMDVWLMSNDAKLINFLAKLFGYCVLVPDERGLLAEISIPKGFNVALMIYDAKVFSQKVAMDGNRKFVRIDSDLWKVRVREMISLLNSVIP
ncbi:MAG TPA: hypothetical protein ENJ60_03615 [Aeromonadales bacterium]|nr:hypothetical protein [Aeromonadales bacterium]